MRLNVTVGWAIDPAGYPFGYLLGEVDEVYLEAIFNFTKDYSAVGSVFQQRACDCYCRLGHLPR